MNKNTILVISFVLIFIFIISFIFEDDSNQKENNKIIEKDILSPLIDRDLISIKTHLHNIDNKQVQADSLETGIEVENTENSKTLLYNSLIEKITKNGLSTDVSLQLFSSSDYSDIINSFEKTENQAYETQYELTETINKALDNNFNSMTLQEFKCNDAICGGVLSYENEADVSEFVSTTFIANKSRPVAILVQPVLVNGNKELRLMLNYKNIELQIH
jgi:hypothetical protein